MNLASTVFYIEIFIFFHDILHGRVTNSVHPEIDQTTAGPSAMHVKEAHVTTETAKPLSVLPDHRDHKDGLLIPIHPIYEQIKHSVITKALSVAHVPE